MNKELFHILGTIILLSSCFFAKQADAQSALVPPAKQICNCLNQKVEIDSLGGSSREILSRCTGEAMAKNLKELSKEFDMGTVAGVKQIREKIIVILNKDCDRFGEMFGKSLEE